MTNHVVTHGAGGGWRTSEFCDAEQVRAINVGHPHKAQDQSSIMAGPGMEVFRFGMYA